MNRQPASHTATAPGTARGAGTVLCQRLETALEALRELRGELAATEDPRLALELASTAQQLEREARRYALSGAERLAATAAHTLERSELDALRAGTADFTREPVRCAGRPSYRTPADLLAAWTGTSFAAARSQLQTAQDLIGRRDAAGNPVPPRFEHLSRVFQNPDSDPLQVCKARDKLARQEPIDATHEGSTTVPQLQTAQGRTVDEQLAGILEAGRRAAETDKAITSAVNDAVARAQDGGAAPRNCGLFRLPQRSAHTREFLLRVPTWQAERIESLISQAANPRTDAGQAARSNPQPPAASPETPKAGSSVPAGTPEAEAGQGSILDLLPEGAGSAPSLEWTPDPDTELATPAERSLNALLALLEAGSSATANSTGTNTGPKPKTVRPELVVYLQVDDLRQLAAGHATTAHGAHVPPGQLRQLLCTAKILPAVLGGNSELLDFGREARLVPASLKRAVLARDRGCLVPGCTAPPEQLEYHHIIPWWAGGQTSLENIAPGCRTHHMDYDSGRIGLTVRDGLPQVLLPAHVDPARQPRRNQYWF